MRLKAYVVFLYGLLLLIGGIIGHVKANSLASLIMGITFSILAIASAYALWKNKAIGDLSAKIISLVLAAFFVYRYLLTEKFMPAGLMVLLSVAVFAILISVKKCKECRNKNA